MAHIQNPILFSKYFGISPNIIAAAGLIDPFLNVDTPLFIDPVLLEKSGNTVISTSAVDRFRYHFEILVRMLSISEEKDDAAWKGARRQIDLSEPPENGLGYGGSGRSGNSRPRDIREAILQTSKEIISLGVKDPDMISLMGFFEGNVGPDTISDLTTTVIMEDLAAITEAFCLENEVPLFPSLISGNHKLPRFKRSSKHAIPIVLVPEDIVNELPIANDWSDIEYVAMENARIRDRVNLLLGSIIHPTVVDRKHALRNAVLESPEVFNCFLSAVKANVSSYDPNLDALGYYRLKNIIASDLPGLKQASHYDLKLGPSEIIRIVRDTVEQFKRHVEVGNLWEELWIGDKQKKERASQLIYYAIADAFCKANDLDISPEANMGGGPIDFKFSSGYSARVLVEMKKSGGAVKHGYEKQLEFYKGASQTEFALFVIIDYGDLGRKLDEILSIRKARLNAGQRASEIVVIDARRKKSSSKRN